MEEVFNPAEYLRVKTILSNILSGGEIAPDPYVITPDDNEIYPCVRCGYCCNFSPCYVAFGIYNEKDFAKCNGTCPALKLNKDLKTYTCLNAEKFKDNLYIGQGCCSALNLDRLTIIHGNVEAAKIEQLRIITNIFKDNIKDGDVV